MHPLSHEVHRATARKTLRVGLITVSSSRYAHHMRGEKTLDSSGDVAESALAEAGHQILRRGPVDDELTMIRRELLRLLYDDKADAVILLGGTGLSARDVTVEAVEPLLEKPLEGFGEVFRVRSYEKIGAATILSRGLGGTIGRRLVFCLPGSPDAVRLGIELILPDLAHASHIAGT